MKQRKKMSKKLSILAVFAVFIAVAMSFVSWLIYEVFAENYRGIKQQYYAVVSAQIVEDIENSVKNGKQIDRFYGMDNVLVDMLELISTETVEVDAAVMNTSGGILYSSVATEENRDSLYAMLGTETVLANTVFGEQESAQYRIVSSGDYEVMLQPIYDREGAQIGVMSLFYHSADIENELRPQKESSNITTALCIGATLLILAVYMPALPRNITEDRDDYEAGSAEALAHKQRQNRFLFLVPVALIMAGLLTQCVLSYNEYQKRYKDVMFEGASGISTYLGEMITELHDKGVPYERMDGLDRYLADKVSASPLLWNVNVVKVYADTSAILGRDSEYTVSMPIGEADAGGRMTINVEVSKEYIDEKMTDMLLVFIVSFAVALIMIYELLKLPDSLFLRVSHSYRESAAVQAKSVAPVMRLATFIAYTGMYVGIPFSSVLITQWGRTLFGLPLSFLASLPMTVELLATMLCSLFLLPLFKRMNLRTLFAVSAAVTLAANVLCFFAGGPGALILCRFLAGIGFAGYKYSLNTIAAQGKVTDADTTDNLAQLNAGLLGGITCGGTLGAVIAGAIGVQTAYLIAAIFLGLFLVMMLCMTPWKLIRGNIARESAAKRKAKEKSSAFAVLGDSGFWRYMLLVAVPMNFGLMFVVAFFPGFVTSLGLPDVTTSYGYLINGLVGIYIGPRLLHVLSQKIGRTACVFLALMMGAVSALIFNIQLPLIIVLCSVALLGLFDGFGTPATSDYYVNLPVVKRLGVSQGLAVLSVVGSAVQTASPVLYSLILSGGLLGTNILGIAFAACAVLFLVTSGLKFGVRGKR